MSREEGGAVELDVEDRPAESWIFPLEWFESSILQGTLQSPLIAPDGNNYNQLEIMQWLEFKAVSPLTQQPLKYNDLRRNKLVERMLQ